LTASQGWIECDDCPIADRTAFSYAGLHESHDQAGAITPLYSADLIGGCIGSLLVSLALAPLAGLVITSYLTIPVVMLSALLL